MYVRVYVLQLTITQILLKQISTPINKEKVLVADAIAWT